ncbi:hypothetical protein R5H30_21245 [Sulfitobacter sp. D35]|uniref:hypothetical protein n=1 Tax=Sulfitobacter sp. D35 TaxID=3083252 RepID=UPI00296E8F81|nr:hypothetical protein [Sulfitobacter sp. D35]MDW4500528.1 hypothetical protein [Sulfitobacter sp. D35]
MTIHNTSDDTRFIAGSNDILRRCGVTLTTGSNFGDYKELLAEGRPDHTVGPPFDPELHDLNEKNAVWIVGRDENGTIMHTQALRALDIGYFPLSEYMRKGFRSFPPPDVSIDYRRSRYRAGPGARQIRGQVCYHGEVWLGGTRGQFRGTGLSAILGRIAFLTAMQRWAPDYLFGIMPKQVAYKGFVERQGYMHTDPGCLRWFFTGNDQPFECMMVYMSHEDLRFMLDLPLSEYVEMAA